MLRFVRQIISILAIVTSLILAIKQLKEAIEALRRKKNAEAAS